MILIYNNIMKKGYLPVVLVLVACSSLCVARRKREKPVLRFTDCGKSNFVHILIKVNHQVINSRQNVLSVFFSFSLSVSFISFFFITKAIFQYLY